MISILTVLLFPSHCKSKDEDEIYQPCTAPRLDLGVENASAFTVVPNYATRNCACWARPARFIPRTAVLHEIHKLYQSATVIIKLRLSSVLFARLRKTSEVGFTSLLKLFWHYIKMQKLSSFVCSKASTTELSMRSVLPLVSTTCNLLGVFTVIMSTALE